MFKRRFLHNTLFVIPYFAQVYLSNRISYRSAVKCVVKRKKSAFRSYAKLKIEICPQVVPFRKYCHILAPCNHFPQQSFQSDRRCSTDNCCKLQAHRTLVAVTALGRLNDLCSFAFISSSPWEGTYTTGAHDYLTEQVVPQVWLNHCSPSQSFATHTTPDCSGSTSLTSP